MVRSKVIPVIMSGGSGARLWPVSTDERPKQFQALDDDLTLIQATALRFANAPEADFLAPVVMCHERHLDLVEAQFSAIGIQPGAIILEPTPRNTCAVAAAATLVARDLDPEALILLTPADHVIRRPEILREAVARAQGVARSRIVCFGVHPKGPATGYGYIKRAEALAADVFRVERFLEKPPLEDAVSYVADGRYDWNTGLFLFAPEVMAEEARRHAPAVWGAVEAAFRLARRDGVIVRLDEEAFGESPSISVDHAVMERTERGAVAPCDPGWSDIGSWAELWKHLPRDSVGNAVVNAVALDCENSLVWASNGKPVAVVGLSDVLVISTDDGVLVVARDRDQDVRKVHHALARLSGET